MLVTDVADELCWRQLCDVGDGFGRFCHWLLVTNIHYLVKLASGTNNQKMSPILEFCLLIVTKIKSPTSTYQWQVVTNNYVAENVIEVSSKWVIHVKYSVFGQAVNDNDDFWMGLTVKPDWLLRFWCIELISKLWIKRLNPPIWNHFQRNSKNDKTFKNFITVDLPFIRTVFGTDHLWTIK